MRIDSSKYEFPYLEKSSRNVMMVVMRILRIAIKIAIENYLDWGVVIDLLYLILKYAVIRSVKRNCALWNLIKGV